jgi:GNAT superfamily N-acetyltransferase
MTDHEHDARPARSQCCVRPARPEDAETIAAFNQAMARETEDLALDADTVRAGVHAVLADPARGRYFVAESDGQLCGVAMITYEWSDWRNAWLWWLQSVYVQPQHRRRGAFTALFRSIVDVARDAGGVCGIRLYVDRRNALAIHTYDRLGLAETGYLVRECSLE